MNKIDCNFDLWKNKNKRRSLDLGSRFIVKNVFVILGLFACFLFLNNKTKNYTNGARKVKCRYHMVVLDHHEDL